MGASVKTFVRLFEYYVHLELVTYTHTHSLTHSGCDQTLAFPLNIFFIMQILFRVRILTTVSVSLRIAITVVVNAPKSHACIAWSESQHPKNGFHSSLLFGDDRIVCETKINFPKTLVMRSQQYVQEIVGSSHFQVDHFFCCSLHWKLCSIIIIGLDSTHTYSVFNWMKHWAKVQMHSHSLAQLVALR